MHEPMTAGGRDGFSVVAIAISMLAMVAAVVGVGFGARAIDESKVGTAANAAEPAMVTLTEFAITPKTISVVAGGSLHVMNEGTTNHNLSVEGTDLKTSDLAAASSATLDLSSLTVGDYTIICTIAGHKGAGMQAALKVTGSSAGSVDSAAHDTTTMDPAQMDAAMKAVTASFPAATKGVGGQLLEPTVLADGTKQFTLTAEIVDWEVEPGKVVKAWTYNGTVPGPTIKVAIGDHVKVVLINKLPESTVIHFHGIRTPNAMDGVPDITQEAVKPGATFAYDFIARGPAVGMYHSHHDAATQVPNGLAGTILIGDLPLPAGVQLAQTYPMMLNDAGVIGLSLNGKSFPATAPVVVKLGDWILVHYLNEGMQAHPMHLHGLEQLVIAKDGNPLEVPYLADTINIAPGERYSVLVHADEPGVWAWHCHILNHAERDTGMFGMVTAMVVQ